MVHFRLKQNWNINNWNWYDWDGLLCVIQSLEQTHCPV